MSIGMAVSLLYSEVRAAILLVVASASGSPGLYDRREHACRSGVHADLFTSNLLHVEHRYSQ